MVASCLGLLFASSYLFETDHSGDFDGIQVPIGIGACVVGIFVATCLLLARAHLRRGGAGARSAVGVIEIAPVAMFTHSGRIPLWTVVQLSALMVIACVVLDRLVADGPFKREAG